MPGSCKEKCPLILLCQSQRTSTDVIRQKLTSRYFDVLDKLKNAADDPFISLDKGTTEAIEDLSSEAGEVGGAIAEIHAISEAAFTSNGLLIDEAARRCRVMELYGDSLGGLVLRCGGFHPKSVETLKQNQIVINQALKAFEDTIK